ncbi:helix-turn-helix transcriptional regulator [Dactylosporangium sp. CS-047395]|uniref:helix-turn-helix transcriptional regulator n=1 Tax=Dactylosporangium sp. CS-047395 TaxID=3239936 RepID=UPI003D8C232C
MTTTMFETRDADAAERMISDTYARMRLDVNGRRTYMRMAWTTLGPHATLSRVTYGMAFTGAGDPFGLLAFGRLRSGTAVYRNGAVSTDYAAGDTFLACQPDREWSCDLDHLDADLTYLDPDLLAQVAGPEPVRFTGYRPAGAGATGRWNHALDFALGLIGQDDCTDNPLIAGSTARLLAATALTVFPNTARADPTIEDRHDAHPASLRRALAFIDDHPGADLSIADVAVAAHVTVRALQLAFRRHLDTTPTAYLRRVRLEHAHRDLAAADPASTTVTAVAARWGFANHSRFTANYRAAYGLPPSRTLRRP